MLVLTAFTAWTGVEYFLSNRHVSCRLWLRILRLLRSGKKPHERRGEPMQKTERARA
jgi:hypothetical protein